jgi:hypothetical protein
MPHFVCTEINDGTNVVSVFSGITLPALEALVAKQMQKAGYVFLPSDADDAMYEKGNRVKRLFLGVFHRYFKIGIRIEESDQARLKVRIHKFSPDVSGGLIGLRQVKKELNQLAQELARL